MPAKTVLPDGTSSPIDRPWIAEAPVALEFNGLSYAVMMATPQDLEDFATGFAMTEGLAHGVDEIGAIDVAETDLGWIVRTNLSGLDVQSLSERARARVSESSCGLCGIENLEAVARPLPAVAPHRAITARAVFAARAAIDAHQALGQATGAAHAAAWCDVAGEIGAIREDVGRHNAMDKLVGAVAREGRSLSPGFILSTARCSFEIVEKAVRAGATTLVTISLPTDMAIRRASEAGLSLWVLAREDSVLLVSDASSG